MMAQSDAELVSELFGVGCRREESIDIEDVCGGKVCS